MSFDFQGFQSVLDQQRQVEEQKQAYREQAKATAKELVALFNFTADELGIAAEETTAPAEKVKRIVKPKYQGRVLPLCFFYFQMICKKRWNNASECLYAVICSHRPVDFA